MTELEMLERIRRKVPAARRSGIVAGIGEDCAVVRVRNSNEDYIYTTDLLLENVHFRRTNHTAAEVGHKALARGLSDIAAMGGTPRLCLLSLGLPGWAVPRWVDGFFRGLLCLADQTGTVLAGGDLAHSDRLVCDVVVAGAVPRGKALRRDGARPGDAIYVSGLLGGSALGLETGRGAAWRRHLRPEPRLELGVFLRGKLRVTAAMDLSDGLSVDLHRLCHESGVAATIDRPLPVFHGASLEHALDGGEDYELLFTARPRVRVPDRFGTLPLTRIGSIRKGRPGEVTFFGWRLPPRGYDHFRK